MEPAELISTDPSRLHTCPGKHDLAVACEGNP